MRIRALQLGAAVVLLLASAVGAVADDPTSILLRQRGFTPVYPGPGPLPTFTESGPCYQGMHAQPRFNGYRCVRDSEAR
jgi:hypothetical protein